MSLDERNAALNAQMAAHPAEEAVQVLVKDAQRRKRQLRLLTISVAFDILLSIALAFGWHSNHELAIRAESNHAAIVRSCETSNDARTKNKQLWDYILALPSNQSPTPEQEKRVTDFKAFVNETFAPRNCDTIK